MVCDFSPEYRRHSAPDRLWRQDRGLTPIFRTVSIVGRSHSPRATEREQYRQGDDREDHTETGDYGDILLQRHGQRCQSHSQSGRSQNRGEPVTKLSKPVHPRIVYSIFVDHTFRRMNLQTLDAVALKSNRTASEPLITGH